MPAVEGLKFTRCIHQMYPEMRVFGVDAVRRQGIYPALAAGRRVGFCLETSRRHRFDRCDSRFGPGRSISVSFNRNDCVREIADLSRRKKQEIS